MPQMTGPELVAFLAQVFPQARAQRLLIDEVRESYLRFRYQPTDADLRPGETIAGPTLMALSDTGMYLAVLAMIGPVALAVTTNLNINFLRKPSLGELTVETTLLKLGKRLAVGEVSIRSAKVEAPCVSRDRDVFHPRALISAHRLAVTSRVWIWVQCMYKTYAALASKLDDFPHLLDAIGTIMREKYDWSCEVSKLKLPVMLVYGDSDMFRAEHEIKFYQLLGGGLQDAGWNRETVSPNRLAIIPDATHYDILTTPRLAACVLPFLNAQSEAKKWVAPRKL